jgi:hypothetical protein
LGGDGPSDIGLKCVLGFIICDFINKGEPLSSFSAVEGWFDQLIEDIRGLLV